MKVILLQDIAKVGKRHEVKDVADGHALHFLIPQGMAKAATPEALAGLEQRKTKVAEEEQAEHEALQNTVNTVDGQTLSLTLKANEQGHLFAAVHAQEISVALEKEMNVMVPKENLTLEEPIKQVGDYDISLVAGDCKGVLHLKILAE